MPPDSTVGFAAADWVLFFVTGLFLLAVGWNARLQQSFERFAERRYRCAGLFFVLPMVLRLALLVNDPQPVPDSAQDFSNMLMADTLLHGRLTNPPHALPEFFETQRPPSSLDMGLTLAMGRFVTGEPWAGVLLASGVFCAGCYWMLRGWVSPEWALLGGMLAVMEFGPLCRWANSYSGGYMTAIGGCVVFGALPRLSSRIRTPWRMALWALAAMTPLVLIVASKNALSHVPTLASLAVYRFFFLPPLYLALASFAVSLRKMRMRWVAATVAACALAASISPGYQPNALASLTCLFVLISVVGLRQISRVRTLGGEIVRVLMVLCVAQFLFLPYEPAGSVRQGNQQRRNLVRRELEKINGPLLIFVRYGLRHLKQNEWVWNDANIDSARVVWAHDLGAEKNEELMRYYPSRKVLWLKADEFIPRPVPYQAQKNLE
jgi:hypothetical protein